MAFAVDILTNDQLLAVRDQYDIKILGIQEQILTGNSADIDRLVSKLERLLDKQGAVNAKLNARGL